MKLKNLVDVLKDMGAKEEVKSSNELQARIFVSTLCYNNSVMIIDDNGQIQKQPIPDPVEEEIIVKQGDKVHGFEVLEILDNFIVLKSFLEYLDGNGSTPKTQFIIEKGECVNLNMYGVYDEVNKTSIKYIEPVEKYD